MDSKALLFGIIGFLLGGLVVSIAATQSESDSSASADQMTMSQMTSGLQITSGADFDGAFISSMIEHHQGAIDMAKLAESRAKHEEIQQLSREIIRAQEGEIVQLRRWHQRWGYESAG